MITADLIIKAVAKKLKAEFSLPVYDQRTTEGFKKSCFFIEIADNSIGRAASGILRDNLPIRITYIALNDKQLKTIIEIRSRIAEMFFNGLEVTDNCYINLEEDISFTLTADRNLECLLEFALYQEIPDTDDAPDIEELETNI